MGGLILFQPHYCDFISERWRWNPTKHALMVIWSRCILFIYWPSQSPFGNLRTKSPCHVRFPENEWKWYIYKYNNNNNNDDNIFIIYVHIVNWFNNTYNYIILSYLDIIYYIPGLAFQLQNMLTAKDLYRFIATTWDFPLAHVSSF
jgi:hypothetical protein